MDFVFGETACQMFPGIRLRASPTRHPEVFRISLPQIAHNTMRGGITASLETASCTYSGQKVNNLHDS